MGRCCACLLRFSYIIRIALVVSIAAILADCAMVDTIDGRYNRINQSSATARNESILLNIVRASHDAPLNFVVISRVSGTTSASMGGGLPSFLTGPYPIATGAPFVTSTAAGATGLNVVEPALTRDVGVGSTTLNSQTNASNSFDLSPLESKEFYTALLSPVDLPTLNFLIHQGYSHELLYWLFFDSIRETIRGRTVEYRNLPSEPCENVLGKERCFRHLINTAITNGLTVEAKTVRTTVSGNGSSGSTGRGNGPTTEEFARFCFDDVLAAQTTKDYRPEEDSQPLLAPSAHEPRCGTKWAETPKTAAYEADTLTFELRDPVYGLVKYRIRPRSTFGIYQFLGRIVTEGRSESVRLRERRDTEERRLFAIERGWPMGSCFIDVKFEGEYYCVPLNRSANTKRIFSILAQLLALKTQTGDLAITPTVRVTR
jgi:hypothetical protein